MTNLPPSAKVNKLPHFLLWCPLPCHPLILPTARPSQSTLFLFPAIRPAILFPIIVRYRQCPSVVHNNAYGVGVPTTPHKFFQMSARHKRSLSLSFPFPAFLLLQVVLNNPIRRFATRHLHTLILSHFIHVKTSGINKPHTADKPPSPSCMQLSALRFRYQHLLISSLKCHAFVNTFR